MGNDTADSGELLAAAVREATGLDDPEPRPGQSRLADDIAETFGQRGHLAGIAPTGVGKSLAVLAPAVQRAVEFGERTVVSTETLGLQSQILDKDAPTVNRAAEQLYGRGVDVAVLKGFSNYVCSMSLDAVARDVIGKLASDRAGRLPAQVESGADFTAIADTVDAMLDDHVGHRVALAPTVRIDETDLSTVDMLAMLSWAARQAADDIATPNAGDKAGYAGNATGQMFGKISVGPDECLGAKSCPLADMCLPLKARERTAEADIIVTNHALLGVQAAHSASVVISNKTIGNIDHLVVDEAHTLPGIVRSQGAGELSGRRIQSTSRVIRRVFDETDAYHEQLLAEASRLATSVDLELTQSAGRFLPAGAVARVGDEANPVESAGTQIEAWIDAAQAIVKRVRRHVAGSNQIKCIRAMSALTKLGDDLKQVREHEVGVARWIEKMMPARPGEREWTVAKTSPVAVAGMLGGAIYTAEDVDTGGAPDNDAPDELVAPDDQGQTEPERYNLSVVAVSATLPKSFPFDAGIQSRLSRYESPFDDAYASSAFYAPKVTSTDIQAIAAKGGNGKARLDTNLHPEWALTNHVIPLVEANNGSALVVTATAATGGKFAERLQQHFAGRFRVYSQWEPRNLRGIIADWKNDIPSVLVGTRSLMSGVDAPGPTCSLVVLDRVPRAPANPVDDARVEVLTDGKSEMSKWTASRFVYASDAALILEQAAGRLIRSITDTGMVAVLDPRLVKNSDLSYGADTRKTYMKAIARFNTRYSSIDKAVAFLAGANRAGALKTTPTCIAAGGAG